jgi:hypothetical protein
MSSPLLSLTSLPLILLTSSSLLSPLEVNLLKLKDFAFVFISYFCEIQRDDLCCVELTERLKEKIEETFGCEYELFIEFTGLISWCKGASIGWHSDDNRSYLKQRDFAAVCYLNSYEKDFIGGLFRFQSGEPVTVAPSAGVSIVLFQLA